MDLLSDLSQGSPTFLGRRVRIDVVVRQMVSMDPHRQLFEIRYQNDPKDQSWALVTSPLAIVMLLRDGSITDSRHAVRRLVGMAVRFNTIVRTPPPPFDSRPQTDNRKFRHAGSPDPTDFAHYCGVLVDLIQRPHMRAAFTMGGIITRIMIDAIHGPNHNLWDLCLDLVTAGPSSDTAYHQPIVKDLPNGMVGVDDMLADEELKTICGSYSIPCGLSVSQMMSARSCSLALYSQSLIPTSARSRGGPLAKDGCETLPTRGAGLLLTRPGTNVDAAIFWKDVPGRRLHKISSMASGEAPIRRLACLSASLLALSRF